MSHVNAFKRKNLFHTCLKKKRITFIAEKAESKFYLVQDESKLDKLSGPNTKNNLKYPKQTKAKRNLIQF
jgi:hypothetical protein